MLKAKSTALCDLASDWLSDDYHEIHKGYAPSKPLKCSKEGTITTLVFEFESSFDSSSRMRVHVLLAVVAVLTLFVLVDSADDKHNEKKKRWIKLYNKKKSTVDRIHSKREGSVNEKSQHKFSEVSSLDLTVV